MDIKAAQQLAQNSTEVPPEEGPTTPATPAIPFDFKNLVQLDKTDAEVIDYLKKRDPRLPVDSNTLTLCFGATAKPKTNTSQSSHQPTSSPDTSNHGDPKQKQQ